MGKIAFVFPGQGAQYVGMGKELYDNIELSREVFEIANEAFDGDVSRLCFEGPKEDLDRTENTQVCVLTASIAALMALKERGIKADAVAGFSLGEYSALVAADVINIYDAVKIVKIRSDLMQDAFKDTNYGMAAIIGLELNEVRNIVEEACKIEFIEVANINCPKQTVIAGHKKALEAASNVAIEKGGKAIRLSVSGAFHTILLNQAADKFYKEIEKFEFKPPFIPIIANETGDYLNGDIKESLKMQMKSSVLWEDSVKRLIQDGFDTFIEIGPGKVLSGFIKKIDRKVRVLNIEDMKSLENTINALGEIKC
ncbi:Malonyl CoA-acyl carrier protein transacylase [Caloramator mitchellensis]|uniref:Malonyl CoA-acyl carrier protein transacylase n=1 Tax=Caloramator mitchellensis TaxID=908809 RepID=A0A0R3JWE0_CALMK|nr:ACP S-malonyltransferase [Caloramator mitchellensis]KRQ87867.1 Malonyl CoA-acyl carrier protein transacylase [Caloramator mitchellensis]